MSELTLFLIRIACLAILWIFVLSAISVIRSDMFGARVPEAARGPGAGAPPPPQPPPPANPRG
ncbi:MAG: FHA domain-containing protein, partial [Nocardioides sp.]|nr:FHA domain-containing protein [Nocardioides sp.]